MVDQKVIQQQLKDLKFGGSPWNQAELRELPHIIHEGEKISELVNGYYEGGVALLVATELRLLLIDKKPFNFLNVEDLRFDMINEIDYGHRIMGATITISTGSKTLKFKSYNQPRLRSLINLVQEHMSNGKKEQSEKADTQQQHLQEINKQLQMYLMAQHQQLQQQLNAGTQQSQQAEPPKPSPQLSDYLFAQQLLEQFQNTGGQIPLAPAPTPSPAVVTQPAPKTTAPAEPVSPTNTSDDMVADARREVFGNYIASTPKPAPIDIPDAVKTIYKGLEISPLTIAYSKLPMMLRNRKFGRPSFHAHSEQRTLPTGQPAVQ